MRDRPAAKKKMPQAPAMRGAKNGAREERGEERLWLIHQFIFRLLSFHDVKTKSPIGLPEGRAADTDKAISTI
jgi:hypothetical protein